MNVALPDIANLTYDQKRSLLRSLIRDLSSGNRNSVSLGDGLCAIDFGSVEERKQLAQEAIRNLTAEDRDEMKRLIATSDRSFTPEEFLNEVNSQ